MLNKIIKGLVKQLDLPFQNNDLFLLLQSQKEKWANAYCLDSNNKLNPGMKIKIQDDDKIFTTLRELDIVTNH